MDETDIQSSFPLRKLLDIIQKQHDAFKYQTASFIEMIHFQDHSQESMKIISQKLSEIYNLTDKVSFLIESSYSHAQVFLKEKVPSKLQNV